MRRAAPLLAVLALPAAALAQEGGAEETVLPDIIVSANRTPTPAAATGSAVSVVTEPDIVADGRPFVLDILATQPGVSVSQAGPAGTTSGFAIRGAPQQYVRVAVDGIEISDPTSTQVQPSLSGFLLDDVSRIEILRGSQSALYGGQAIAGVIDITSPRATADGLQSTYLLEGGTYGTARGSYSLAGRNGRGEFALTVSHLQTDGFSAAEEADGNAEPDGYDGTRVSGSGTFQATDTLSIFGSAFTQHESGDFDGDPVTFALTDRDNTYDATTWGARTGLGLTTGNLESRAAISWYDTDRTTDEEDFGRSTFEGDRLRVEYLGAYTGWDALLLQFGGDWSRETANTTSPYGDTRGDADIAGIFGQAIWQPTDALTLTAALRDDDHSEFGNYPIGRLSAAWSAASATTVRASVGSGFRAPSLYELFSPSFGNPDLDAETSISADLGVEQGFASGRGLASATLFLLDIDDLIDFVDSRFEQTSGTAKSRGLELAGSYEVTDTVSLTGTYTYTDARYANGDRRLRVPLHDLNLGVEAAPTAHLTAGVEVEYAAGLRDEPFAESVAWRSDYTVVNARLAYAVTEAAQLYLRAENLFDEEYQTVEGYSTSGSAVYFGVRGTF